MKWIFEKFYGDGAIYAFCPKCGFYHCVSDFKLGTHEIEINKDKIYKFCPMCGKKDTTKYDDNIDVIWNERSIFNESFEGDSYD